MRLEKMAKKRRQKQFSREREKGIKLQRVESFVPNREHVHAEPEIRHNIPLCLSIINDIINIYYGHLVIFIHIGQQLSIN